MLGHALVSLDDRDEKLLRPLRSDNLKADRQAVRPEITWEENSRHACEVAGRHQPRIPPARTVPRLEERRRRPRVPKRDKNVVFGEERSQLGNQDRPKSLGVKVVARAYLEARPEAGLLARIGKLLERGAFDELRKDARALGPVDGSGHRCERQARQYRRLDPRPDRLSELPYTTLDGGTCDRQRVVRDLVFEVSEAQPPRTSARGLPVPPAESTSRQSLEHDCAVLHRSGQWSDLVERPRERHRTRPVDEPKRRS
jgi:hypothetical protein